MVSALMTEGQNRIRWKPYQIWTYFDDLRQLRGDEKPAADADAKTTAAVEPD